MEPEDDEITVTIPVEESAPEIVEGGDAVVIVAPDSATDDASTAALDVEHRLTVLEGAVADLALAVSDAQFTAEVAQAEAGIALDTAAETAAEVPDAVADTIEGAPVAENEDGQLEVMPDTPPASHGPGFLFASREDWRKRKENNR